MSEANAQPANLKQPRELMMLFFAEMWERFSFYGMRALLTLYLTTELFKDLANGDDAAIGVYAAYGALVYTTPFVGGIIADKLLGFKKSVLLGALLMAVGHFVMAIENELFLYIALSFLIVGNGFFKPNISSMVGGLYEENDPRRDGGFTIFYVGINLGAMLAPLTCGYLGETYGWFWGFGLAGVGMLLGYIVFGRGQANLKDNGDPPNPELLKKKVAGLSVENLTYVLSFVAVAAFTALIWQYELVAYVLTPFVIGVLLFIFVVALRSEKVVRERLFVILILLFFTTLFWAFFEQAGSSITLFTNTNVDRGPIPASLFQSVNPFYIILLAPLFSMLWIKLGQIGKDPNPPLKFSLGIAQLGLGFLVMNWALAFTSVGEVTITADGESTQQAAALVPVFFLFAGYFLHTTGELCLSPVGLSMVTKLAPKKIMAMIMGAWFLSSAMAHTIGGVIAQMTNIPDGGEGTAKGQIAIDLGLIDDFGSHSEVVLESYDKLATYGEIFGQLGWIAVGAAVLLLLLSPLLRKWMHGIH